MSTKRLTRTWDGHRPQVRGGAARTVTVTFDYGDGDLRTLVAPSRKAAFQDASTRWGWGWQGEPCVSSADSIYNDLIGWTKAQHGQDFGANEIDARNRSRFRQTGQSYDDA